ncbi:MAG: hypothetical protein JWP95_1520 [Actinotalea sp.]|nr:hypothetical protein [Actinotalea sp.]
MTVARTVSTTRTTVAAALLLVVALAGCGGSPAEPGMSPAPEDTPVATAEEPVETAEPAETETEAPADPEEEPAAAAVQLSGTGIGDVVDGTPDALPAVEALLGPADGTDDSPLADCGAPQISSAQWGSLTVWFSEGALYGWQTNSAEGFPESAAWPDDLPLGTPMSEVLAAPGAGPVDYLENYQQYEVTAEGVTWWFDGEDPTSLAVLVGHNVLGCG